MNALYFSKLQTILEEQKQSCVLEIQIGSKKEVGFQTGFTEEEINPILDNIIKTYGKPHYYRSTTAYQNNLELSTYGKNKSYKREKHQVSFIEGIGSSTKDLQVNIITKSKYPSEKFPMKHQYHKIETVENAVFNVNNIKIIVSHIIDKKIIPLYLLKVVLLYQPFKLETNLLELSKILEFVTKKD